MVFGVPCQDRYGHNYTMEVVVPTKTFLNSEIDRYHGWEWCSVGKAKLIRKTKCKKIEYTLSESYKFRPRWEEVHS